MKQQKEKIIRKTDFYNPNALFHPSQVNLPVQIAFFIGTLVSPSVGLTALDVACCSSAKTNGGHRARNSLRTPVERTV